MTTRRWMIVAAAIAMALGGYRESNRLKQWRDAYLMRATWHAEAETYHRRLSRRPRTRTDRRVEADQEPAPGAELDKAIEFVEFGLSPERSNRSEAHDRFREAQARQYALARKIRKLADEYDINMLMYCAKQTDYHAALAKKYRDAASRPWLAVEPDPPKPY
jgi:hypothetical protein